MLNTMGGAARQGVHQTVADEVAEFSYTEVLLQSWIDAMVEHIADTQYTDTLACIREGFRTLYCKDIIVCVMGYSGLERCLERMR